MSYAVTTPPTESPVSVEDMKDHLRILGDDGSQNALIQDCIDAAAAWFQEQTRTVLMQQTLTHYLDMFPRRSRLNDGRAILLAMPPLQSVTSVRYLDTENDAQTLDAELYDIDAATHPGRIRLKPTASWPATVDRANAVEIEAIHGYASATDVPHTLRAAVKMLASLYYENAEAAGEKALTAVPMAVQTIVEQHAMPRL